MKESEKLRKENDRQQAEIEQKLQAINKLIDEMKRIMNNG